VTLFGPLLRFELVRSARRQRLTLFRTVYAAGLLAVVATTYYVLTDGGRTQPEPHFLALTAQGLFLGLFAAQAALAVVLTPQWAADAISGEKERQTLPFLLLTDLSSREIVVGKLAARLAQVFVVLLTGLPVLCFLQFFGGVEPLAVFVGDVALAATLLSLGSLGVLCSVYARNIKAATQGVGRIIGLYVLLLILGRQALAAWPRVAFFPGTPLRPAAVSVQDLYDLLDAGNPYAFMRNVYEGLRIGGTFEDVLWPAARDYVLFHLTAAAVCVGLAVWRLRPVAAARGDGPPPPPKAKLLGPPPRPPVGDRPVLWKALYFDYRQVRSAAGRVIARCIFLLSFAPLICAVVISGILDRFHTIAKFTNSLCRGLVTAALCGMLIIIAGQAAAAVGRERRKKTLDDLLLTDLSTDEILAQKWLGSIGVVRWGLAWVAVHWVVGVVTGGLHPLAVPALAVEWSAYAGLAASLGLYFAARTRTVNQASTGTGLAGFALAVLPLVVATVMAGLMYRQAWGWLFVVPLGMSPPAALGLSAFSLKEPAEYLTGGGTVAIAAGAAGVALSVALSGLLAWRLWRGACEAFERSRGGTLS
jgi:ABC-type transport system involved in multi-copper enzyme maturation permease subunit